MRHQEDLFDSAIIDDLTDGDSGSDLTNLNLIGVALTEGSTGRILRVNPRCCAMLGYSESELLERTFLDITYPTVRDANWKIYQEVVNGERPSSQFEKRYVRKDGQVIWVELDLMSVPGEGDEPRRALAFMQDITAKKLLIHGQQLHERELQSLINAIPHLAWIGDPDGKIQWFNERWLNYTGSTAAESAGEGWTKFLHPNEVDLFLNFLRPAWLAGEPWEITIRLRSRTGEYRTFLSRGVPIFDDHLRTLRWVGTQTDVTGQQKAQEKLRRALATRDEFLSIASHELRTPLASLQLQLQLLAHRAAKNGGELTLGRDDKVLGLLARQTHQLMHLVEAMFDVARIDSGKLEMKNEVFDVGQLASETMLGLQPKFEAQKIELSGFFEDHLCVRGDRLRLEQVLSNLLVNALKFGDRKPVRLTVRGHENTVEIIVQDQGIGIAPADQLRIFRRFERAVSSTQSSGLGLGLYIAGEIVKAHGGQIHLRSQPHQGSTFQVDLPRFIVSSRE